MLLFCSSIDFTVFLLPCVSIDFTVLLLSCVSIDSTVQKLSSERIYCTELGRRGIIKKKKDAYTTMVTFNGQHDKTPDQFGKEIQ